MLRNNVKEYALCMLISAAGICMDTQPSTTQEQCSHNHSSAAGIQERSRCPRRTLADGVIGGAAHVEACVAAAVLGLVHLRTARPPAEGRVVHDAPLRRG